VPTFHVCFARDEHEPYPPLADMTTMDADSPLAAVEALLRERKWPRDNLVRWARVVIESVDGKPTKALRFPLTPEWDGALDYFVSDEDRQGL
jgi:hypothetical protein